MWNKILLWSLIIGYAGYFSYASLDRYYSLGSSHLDIGVLHQAAYNTYRGIATGDFGRILEVTKEYDDPQITFLGWHNDILLAFASLLYFIHAGPETLLILQALVLALGGLAVFLLARTVFEKNRLRDILALAFAAAFLLYPPMQRANLFDFHTFALAPTLVIFGFYFTLKKRFFPAALFLAAAILTRENVALTTVFLGAYFWISNRSSDQKTARFGAALATLSVFWFFFSVQVVIPYFRGGEHFAMNYYGDFGSTPGGVIVGALTKPGMVWSYLARADGFHYFLSMFGPLGFLSFFNPIQLLTALPEFGLVLLSNKWYMRSIFYHYTSLVQPFIFISAIYGVRNALEIIQKRVSGKWAAGIVISWLAFGSLSFAYLEGPLPFAREYHTPVHRNFAHVYDEAKKWSISLGDENIKVSASSNLALLFSGRRHFYVFHHNYGLADYVVVNPSEFDGRQNPRSYYDRLRSDPNFERIYKNQIEVYKKL